MPRTLTIDLTDAAEKEVERLRKESGLTTADLFRVALSYTREIHETYKQGGSARISLPQKSPYELESPKARITKRDKLI